MKSIIKDTPITYFSNMNSRGETILFLHAAFADHTSFDEQVAHFDHDCHVLTLDILGHGESVNAAGGEKLADMAGYINTMLNQERVDKVHLCGVALGAVIAQDFANKYPKRVASLACIGSYDINNFDPEIQENNRTAQVVMTLGAMISMTHFARSNSRHSLITPSAQAAYAEMILRFKRRSFRYLAAIPDMVNKQKTARRNYPLLIASGSDENPILLDLILDWHKREPASQFTRFRGAGHLANMDAPELFNKTYEAFLNRVRLSRPEPIDVTYAFRESVFASEFVAD